MPLNFKAFYGWKSIKILLIVNFFVLNYWVINAYLYGLIVEAVLSVALNILFVSHEIKLPFLLFNKAHLCANGYHHSYSNVHCSISKNSEQIDIIKMTIKGSLFTVLYISMNYILKTSSFDHF